MSLAINLMLGVVLGSQIAYYIRRLVSEAWIRGTPYFTIRVGTFKIKVPINARDAARLVRDWKPDWKAAVIKQHYNPGDGGFVDVGTNIGETLLDFLYVAGNSGGYIGFEPNFLSTLLISQIIQHNQLKNARIIPCGLSNQMEIVRLFTRSGHPTDAAASIIEGLRPGQSYEEQLIPCLKFSAISDDLDLQKISFIKIDVEGAELAVLKGMEEFINDAKPTILCEVLLRDPSADSERYTRHINDLAALLRSMRYDIFRILKGSRGHVEYERCSEFPNDVFTDERASYCDYLFSPSQLRK